MVGLMQDHGKPVSGSGAGKRNATEEV